MVITSPVLMPKIALHVAALYQRWNIVRELSKKYPKLLTVLNGTEGKTPLFYVFAVLRDPIRGTTCVDTCQIPHFVLTVRT
jgi:hypothetical protein